MTDQKIYKWSKVTALELLAWGPLTEPYGRPPVHPPGNFLTCTSYLEAVRQDQRLEHTKWTSLYFG